MKIVSKTRFVFMVAIGMALLFFAASASAQEDREGDKTASTMVPKEEYGKIPAGWMVVQGRYGATTSRIQGSFTFDEIPETSEAEDSFTFSTPVGWMDYAGIDFLFFPTDGRRFLLSVSGEHQSGTFAMKIDEEDYAYEIGLDSKTVDYYLSDILFGIGYRWLRGARFQHAATLAFKFGGGASSMAVDGFANSNGGAGIVGVGAGYMYRFENRIHMGIQLDLRGFGSRYPQIKINNGDNEIDAQFGGFMGVLSGVIGWETL